MSAAGDPVLTEVVRRLVEAYSPERTYLFGSVARGAAGPDSDYDIMVMVSDDAPPERLRSRLGYLAALNDALDALAARDERKARVVELRFFGGPTAQETADTVLRDWRLAKGWPLRELTRSHGG